MKPSDINIDKLKSGDEHEFRLLFDLLYPRMMSVACRFVSEDAAEDIVQEVFVKYWENKTVLSPDSIQSFLYKCTQNGCLNYIKHQAIVSGHKENVKIAEERIIFQSVNAGESNSWDEIVARDADKLIAEAIAKLSPKAKEAFELSFYKGLKHREIAEIMDISPRTVEEYVQKSTKFLRADLRNILFDLITMVSCAEMMIK